MCTTHRAVYMCILHKHLCLCTNVVFLFHVLCVALRTWSTLLIQRLLVAMVTSSFGKFTSSTPPWELVPVPPAAGQCLHELWQCRLWLLFTYLKTPSLVVHACNVVTNLDLFCHHMLYELMKLHSHMHALCRFTHTPL